MPTGPDIIDFPYRSDVDMLFSRLRRLDGAIWLDSGKPRSRQGRFDILSALPQWRLETRGHETLLSTARGVRQPCSGDPFVAGDELLAEMGLVSQDFAYLPFVGGLMGYWQYDLGLAADGPCLQSPAATTMRLGWYGWGLVIDHQARRGWLIFHPRCDPKIRIRITKILQSTDKKEQIEFTITRPFRSNTTRADYLDTVRRIGDYISAGDCYQVNYAQRFSAGYRGDPWAAYRKLRQAVPSPYGAYLDWEGEALLCASPERFLKVSLGQVETKPIKGTIARGRTLAEDEENAISLMNSGKDRAENLMIVDLLRNDLGKHCVPGSIKVPKLFALESFANVHHLVSTVTGTLAPGSTPLQLLRDAFPGGSITGAPKKRAMEIIAELETAPRGLYCGSIGYMSATGRLDSNIAIRTLVASGDEIHCWGGGGIVADSVAEREYEESLQKVAVLMKTLEGA